MEEREPKGGKIVGALLGRKWTFSSYVSRACLHPHFEYVNILTSSLVLGAAAAAKGGAAAA